MWWETENKTRKPVAVTGAYSVLSFVSSPRAMATASDIGQCLQNTLSSDPNTRISAELKLGELLALPGAPIAQSDRGDPFSLRELLLTRFTDAGLVLSHIGLAQDADMSLRQMSNRVLSKLGAS